MNKNKVVQTLIRMNRSLSIFLTLVWALMMCGCDDMEDLSLEQKEDIETFLTESHDPLLISLSDAAESLETDPPFYVTAGSTTFMYITDYYNAQRDIQPQIEWGSTVSITYSIYDFDDQTTPSVSTLLDTNDADMIAELVELGLNPEFWSSEPLVIKVGSAGLFESVESLLVGCREGDEIEFYMTLNEAYGKSIIGLSTVEAPLALFCEILEVN
ncbi:MAG: hypothetical protein SNG02_07305 [Rikenellaceae bacterium]